MSKNDQLPFGDEKLLDVIHEMELEVCSDECITISRERFERLLQAECQLNMMRRCVRTKPAYAVAEYVTFILDDCEPAKAPEEEKCSTDVF